MSDREDEIVKRLKDLQTASMIDSASEIVDSLRTASRSDESPGYSEWGYGGPERKLGILTCIAFLLSGILPFVWATRSSTIHDLGNGQIALRILCLYGIAFLYLYCTWWVSGHGVKSFLGWCVASFFIIGSFGALYYNTAIYTPLLWTTGSLGWIVLIWFMVATSDRTRRAWTWTTWIILAISILIPLIMIIMLPKFL